MDYSLGAFGSEDQLYVWDHATNNIASKPVKDISGVWNLRPEDFKLIGKVSVHLEHHGQPLQAAQVKLSTKSKSVEKLIDPSSAGTVQFFGIPAGEVTVRASYNTSDKKEASIEQVFKLSTNRDRPEPILALAIGDDVPVSSGSTSESKQPDGKASLPAKDANNSAGSGVGKFVFMAVAGVLVAGAFYLLMGFMKRNPQAFEEKLTKLGVQIPKPADADDAAPASVAPLPLAPAPPQKIILEDADPTVLGSNPPPMTSSFASSPTLVGEDGTTMALPEGETLVGREAGLAMSLPSESTVSRRHASIRREASGEVIVTDLGSTNGTFVNGMRLQGETALRPGDQIQFGQVKFRYEG